MQASQLVPFFLFLHVLGAIVAFGPTFAYSIMASLARQEPQHSNFSVRQIDLIGKRLVYPLAIFQAVTGVLLIWAAGINVMSSLWLMVAIVLYIFTLTYALTVQRNAIHRMIELTATQPPPGTPPGPPPPELLATAKRIQQGGMLLGTMIVVIVFLMVVKPTI